MKLAVFHGPDSATAADPVPFDVTLNQVLIPYGLKEVERTGTVGKRKESVAEHIASMLDLACWFMDTYELKLNFRRVVDIIRRHDLPELDCGDTPIIPGVDNRADKDFREARAAVAIAGRMSSDHGGNFLSILAEYKAGQTDEAKFVRAIDKLDADLHFLKNKDAWATWSDEFYRSTREPHYRKVPEISEFYDNLLQYLRSNGYLQPESRKEAEG